MPIQLPQENVMLGIAQERRLSGFLSPVVCYYAVLMQIKQDLPQAIYYAEAPQARSRQAQERKEVTVGFPTNAILFQS